MALPIVQLVGDLYGCLTANAPTSAALDVLCEAMGATHAIVTRRGPDCGIFATSHHLTAVPPPQFDGIDRSSEYRQLIATTVPGSVVRITDLVPRADILVSEMYQTMLRPLDGGLAIYGLHRDGPDLVVAAICRSAAVDPDFDHGGVALLQAAMPHFAAITGIAARMENERREGRRIRDALDLVDDGVIVLGEDRRLVHANAAAGALLDRGDRLRRAGTGIAATQRADEARLRRAIDAAQTLASGVDTSDRDIMASRSFQVVLGRSELGSPLIATVVPADGMSAPTNDGAVVIHLRDPACAQGLSFATLRQELGLTAREAMLVGELACGATLTLAAGNMEISIGTARQYLKTIFLKTNVSGQSELLRLISR